MSHIYYRHTTLKSILNEIKIKETIVKRITDFLEDNESQKLSFVNDSVFDTYNYDLVLQLALRIVGQNYSIGNEEYIHFKDCTIHYTKLPSMSIIITKESY